MVTKTIDLIPTALEETWPNSEGNPVIFFGEWCKLYSRRLKWSAYDSETVPYHWDDRIKLYDNYLYLDSLYEKALSLLAESLNKIHGERHSINYWRILIGPWLGHFIQILFDRHEVVQSVNFDYKIKYNLRKPKYRDPDSMIPLDMHEFQELHTGDNWNAYIFAEILSELCLPNICISEVDIFYNKPEVKNENSLRFYLKKILSSAFSAKNQKIFMAATFMPKLSEIILQIKLGQTPRPVIFNRIEATQINPIIREKSIDLKNNNFEKLLGRMILRCIPIAYLEGYKSLNKIVENTGWPKNPKIIWTSNAETFEETFKCYAAKNIEKSTKLFIGQHGGNFGLGLWSYQEDHHLKISFKYLSWGWIKNNCTNIYPVGRFSSKIPTKIKYVKNDMLLLVTAMLSRYSYHMYSVPVAGQMLRYIEEQFIFYSNLNENIKKKILIRSKKTKLGWEDQERWVDKFPGIKVDNGSKSLLSLMRECKIYVSTYNATTYLESLSANIPTIIYWNPSYWELRTSAIEDFLILENVGIFHASPESAAKKVNEVWDDVDAWWKSEDVQRARQYFCNKYAKDNPNLLADLKRLFLTEIN